MFTQTRLLKEIVSMEYSNILDIVHLDLTDVTYTLV